MARKTALFQREINGMGIVQGELFSRISALSLNPKRAFFEMPLFEWHEVAGSKVSGGAIMRSAVQMVRLIARSRLGTFGHSASTAIGGGMPASVKVA